MTRAGGKRKAHGRAAVDPWLCNCVPCQTEADRLVDAYLDAQPEREQRERERLDSEGWHAKQDAKRKEHAK
jgi:hypothetical protein